ncbi:hypothetical protein BDZ91DRAFT_725363 [Kalaharituber pfeilii]|nr:hypothetical protein BDZ91DRAFT_725363 [Kalaharituber pfeilii]
MADKMDLSLDEMIQRERRARAASVESKGRPHTPLGPRGGFGKHRHGGSTIGKPPSPAPTGVNGRWVHDLHHKNNPLASRVTKSTPLPSSITPSVAKSLSNNRLFTALHGDANTTSPPTNHTRSTDIIPTPPAAGVDVGMSIRGAARQTSGFTIKGAAGPFVVRASNLAPGTTAEDVKTAMQPLGKIVSCIMLAASPTAMAEIVFEKKESADACVSQYNNQIADGRRLHVVLHPGPPIGRPSYLAKSSSPAVVVDHNAAREEADRQRRLVNQQYMNGGVIDGTYGFKAPVLYSDQLVAKRGRGFQG